MKCGKWSLNSSFLCNSCFNWLFISNQNLPFADANPLPEFHIKSPLEGHMATGYLNLSQYVLVYSKSYFAGKVVWWDNINSFYQNLLITVKVAWKKSKRSWGVLGIKKLPKRKTSTIHHCIVLNTFNRQSTVYK